MTHVDPDIAVKEMTTLWRSFGQEVSSQLQDTWRRMCMALNDAGNRSVGWTILAMPTGIGKTLFTAPYCSLLETPPLSLHNIKCGNLHPGFLFVTRLATETEQFRDHVNNLAGRTIAAAYHSNSDTPLSSTVQFPVLAITHAGCERHQSRDGTDGVVGNVWDQLTTWQLGSRAKIIIDETPNFTTSVKIETKELAQTLGAFAWLRDANKELYVSMERILTTITNPSLGSQRRRITDLEFRQIQSIDTGLILEHIKSVDDDALTVGQSKEKTSLRRTCTDTIEAIGRLQRNGWGWVSFKERIAQLHSAALHPSLQSGSGIILDATADLYLGYSLLSPPAKVITATEHTRRYDNVTLYLAWGHNAGKANLVKSAHQLWPQHRRAIENVLPANHRFLICCHEDFEQAVCNDPDNSDRITFAHYNNIDGRNDWKDYEAVALIGLFYLPVAAHINALQALLGPQTDEWLQSSQARTTNASDDVVTLMQRGHLAATAIQAICRVRCRRVIDTQGQCLTNEDISATSGKCGRTCSSRCNPTLHAWNTDRSVVLECRQETSAGGSRHQEATGYRSLPSQGRSHENTDRSKGADQCRISRSRNPTT